jgi:hypothetical protein
MPPPESRIFQIALLSLLLLDGALVLLGLALYPKVIREGGLLGVGSDVLILAVYGFLALRSRVSLNKSDPGDLARR